MPSFIAPAIVLRRAPVAARYAYFRRVVMRPYTSTMHDNDPEVLETEKRRNLSRKEAEATYPHPNAPGWNETLASVSEAEVKADRDPVDFPADELQARTVEYVRTRYNPDDRLGPTTADYTRDEVSGPLKSALGHEEQDIEETVVRKIHKEKTIQKDEMKGA